MVSTLNDNLRQMPTYTQTLQDAASLTRMKDTLPLLDTSNPEAFTVLSASLPMLYQSNSRAQSEIDSFRSRKGITESIGDWAAKAAGGTATKETIDNMKELIGILDASITAQRAREAGSVVSAYSGIIPKETLDRWYSNQLSDVTASTEDIVNRVLGQ
jgi:hypothetical protein